MVLLPRNPTLFEAELVITPLRPHPGVRNMALARREVDGLIFITELLQEHQYFIKLDPFY